MEDMGDVLYVILALNRLSTEICVTVFMTHCDLIGQGGRLLQRGGVDYHFQ